MKEETIQFVDLMMQDEYGRGLSENEKKFLRQVTKDTHIIYPRRNGRETVNYMLMVGLYYEAMTGGEKENGEDKTEDKTVAMPTQVPSDN